MTLTPKEKKELESIVDNYIFDIFEYSQTKDATKLRKLKSHLVRANYNDPTHNKFNFNFDDQNSLYCPELIVSTKFKNKVYFRLGKYKDQRTIMFYIECKE